MYPLCGTKKKKGNERLREKEGRGKK